MNSNNCGSGQQRIGKNKGMLLQLLLFVDGLILTFSSCNADYTG
jgi:hypothetical protein